MKELDHLSQELGQLAEAFGRRFQIGEVGPMTQMLKELSKRHESGSVPQDLLESVLRKAKQGHIPSTRREIKCLCFGLCQPLDSDAWVLIEDSIAFGRVMAAIDTFAANPSALIRCYQGLLLSLFRYQGARDDGHKDKRKNWEALRTFLEINLDQVSTVKPISTWVEILKEHKNLLGNDPCKRYGDALLSGTGSEFREVCAALGVPADSWVWDKAVLAQVEALNERNDEEFKKSLDGLLRLLDGKANLTVPEPIVIRGLAKIIIRYSICDSKDVHEKLRDLAVSKIGNPWLRRDAWQGYVANENAREMVNGWLKRRLITDFFEILSEDGSSDSRRLKFWMKFEPLVTDLWIAFGSSAMNERGSNYQELRKRAQGRLLHLEGPANQNAFIMRIGQFYVVEFGKIGRCFFYEEEERPFRLDALRVSGDYKEGGLKSRDVGHRIAHLHNWEEAIQNWLCPKLNWWPPSSQKRKPRQTAETIFHSSPQKKEPRSSHRMKEWTAEKRVEIFQHIKKYELEYKDFRSKGGAFWVLFNGTSPPVTAPLRQWGFKYKPKKGWWME